MPCREPTTSATANATTKAPSAGHGAILGPENESRASKSHRAVGIAHKKCNNESATCRARWDFNATKMAKSLFFLLNLTVPWGLLTKNATANRPSAGHGVISMPRKITISPFFPF